ncbi:membrane-associated protein, putative [Bodo saltans]|uniref:Membrane-associated protein, putative n=1 Tax=Bodo saltans TaxID=75058 RepID=A0A0S4IH43_BODSA|nr:membrane-associated protein, putative [Bodo saltans]|eukprot:CUE55164.1 membrane-associated protein, putative [Bodo saltans]
MVSLQRVTVLVVMSLLTAVIAVHWLPLQTDQHSRSSSSNARNHLDVISMKVESDEGKEVDSSGDRSIRAHPSSSAAAATTTVAQGLRITTVPRRYRRTLESFHHLHIESNTETPMSWMRDVCSTTSSTTTSASFAKALSHANSQHRVDQKLGWGTTSINNQIVCVRGRRVFREYHKNDSQNAGEGSSSWWSQKKQQVPLYNVSDLKVAFPSLASLSSSQPAVSTSLPSLPPERPQTHRDIVLHADGTVGIIAATYLHGFHVLVNTLIPLVHTLLTKVTGSRDERRYTFDDVNNGADGEEDKNKTATSSSPPSFDVTLLRHPYFGAKFSGGETLSHEFISALLVTAPQEREIVLGNATAGSKAASNGDNSALVMKSPRVLHRADFLESERTTHCYCNGAVLHDMIDSEFMSSVPQTERIVSGDPLRRRSTRFIKESLNKRYGFVPYGTYPIPPQEYLAHGLWGNHHNDTTDDGHNGKREKVPTTGITTTATATPRLLLLLRNRTRELGDADAVIAMARAAGFHVHVMVPDRETIALQARAARYADLMMGVHGQALTWSLMMDGTRASHCREVVELTGFGRPLRGMQNVFEVLAADSYLRYTRTQPVDVDFVGATCGPCPALRKILLTAKFPQTRRAFNWQRVWFGASRELPVILKRSFASLEHCLLPNKPVPLPASFVEQSDKAVPNYPGGKI